MISMIHNRRMFVAVAVAGVVAMVSGCAAMRGGMAGESVTLGGASEVPPVTTSATGSGTVTIGDDHNVSARITVSGMTATAAHIHEAAAGANGPVIVPLTMSGDNTFVAAPGAKLTASQHASYKAGRLYVNVHSAKNPGGEVRAQLKGR